MITSHPVLTSYDNIIIRENIDAAYKEAESYCDTHNCDKCFIIGGASIYKQTINDVDVLDITILNDDYEGDTYFPEIDFNIWKKSRLVKEGTECKFYTLYKD